MSNEVNSRGRNGGPAALDSLYDYLFIFLLDAVPHIKLCELLSVLASESALDSIPEFCCTARSIKAILHVNIK